jgi:4-hydroxy-2-oxoheptanedioate aldolase
VTGDVQSLGRNSAGSSPFPVYMFISITSPEMISLAIRAGYDGIVLDLEHGFPVGGEVRATASACHAQGGKCVVRLAPSQASHVAAMVDQGVDGVLLSNASSLQEITALSRLVTFPPNGERSLNPFVPAAGLPGDTSALLNTHADLWAMAETPGLLHALQSETAGDEIRGRLGALVVGPYDLAARLGGKGHGPENNDLRRWVAAFAVQAKRLGLRLGLFVRDAATLDVWLAAGFEPSFVIGGYDSDVWFTSCVERTQAIHQVLERFHGGSS